MDDSHVSASCCVIVACGFGCEIVSFYCLRKLRVEQCCHGPFLVAYLSAMPRIPARMSTDEKRLVRSMNFDKGMTAATIASATGRHISSVCRLLAQRREPAPVGRPTALSVQQVDRLECILNNMVDKAYAQHEVTMSMLMKRSKCNASTRTVSDVLHARGFHFSNLRQKPILCVCFCGRHARPCDDDSARSVHAQCTLSARYSARSVNA